MHVNSRFEVFFRSNFKTRKSETLNCLQKIWLYINNDNDDNNTNNDKDNNTNHNKIRLIGRQIHLKINERQIIHERSHAYLPISILIWFSFWCLPGSFLFHFQKYQRHRVLAWLFLSNFQNAVAPPSVCPSLCFVAMHSGW